MLLTNTAPPRPTTHSAWQLGTQTFQSRAIQGPLAGYSNSAFRRLLWSFGGLAYACTEMLPANIVIHEDHTPQNRFTWRHPSEACLCYQLSGFHIERMLEAAMQMRDLGADIIDINAGCPKTKIRKKQQGSALLDNPKHLQRLLQTLKAHLDIPITVKIRVPKPTCQKTTQALIEHLNDSGVDGIIMHGRHWQDDYQQALRIEHMQTVVTHATCPVIVNGDVASFEDHQRLLQQTGATAVMIARAGFHSPWLFEQIRCAEAGQPFSPPTLPAIGQLLQAHIQGLFPFMSEKQACLQARTIGRYYSRHLPEVRRTTFLAEWYSTPPQWPALENILIKTFAS